MAGPLWPRGRRGSTDEALIRAVYEEHGNALLAYATRLTGDRAAAEDVVQETLIRAWRHTDALVNGKGSVRGWLLTVARNIITDRYRARAARPAEIAESPATPPVAEDHADAVVDTMTVLGALDRLSPEHRDVLRELYYRQRSVAEVAEALGIPAGTVKSRSHYALRALRETFKEDDRPSVPQRPAGLREVVA
ncbi:sigma-70 family RNA polymerase sigma factor [Streptomyces showdoensis]|uniref:RNA polymerase n=1 Tax=Streptomyces showdoensis TaxID=68268 RepID=A0A2P2GNT1_STREW|nr:sigma-70 family RNA polymerase sigma factor [Streptomyces showdoensis]KKZ73167.1 RNA polymerase [Streptomyces showdoensis]